MLQHRTTYCFQGSCLSFRVHLHPILVMYVYGVKKCSLLRQASVNVPSTCHIFVAFKIVAQNQIFSWNRFDLFLDLVLFLLVSLHFTVSDRELNIYSVNITNHIMREYSASNKKEDSKWKFKIYFTNMTNSVIHLCHW